MGHLLSRRRKPALPWTAGRRRGNSPAYDQPGSRQRQCRVSEASTVAVKLLNVHNDADGLSAVADAMMQTAQYSDALTFFSEHSERMLAADSAKVLQSLHTIIGHVRDNPQHLLTLLDLFQ